MKINPAFWCLVALWLGVSGAVAQEKPPATAAPDWAQVAEQARIANEKLKQGKTEEAATAFEAADRLALGQSCAALVALAAVQLQMEKPEQAEQTAKRALAQDSCDHEHGAALQVLGLASFQTADFKEAELRETIALFEKAVGLGGPSLPSSKFMLANLHNVLGESEKAALRLRELLGSLPAKDDIAKDARILLCQIRRHHPELRPESPAGGLQKGEPVFQVPESLFKPTPDYPKSPGLFAPRPWGKVVIKTIIDQEGCVVEPKVVKSDAKELEPAALEKIAEWTYLPGTRNGVAIDVDFEITVDFSTGG